MHHGGLIAEIEEGLMEVEQLMVAGAQARGGGTYPQQYGGQMGGPQMMMAAAQPPTMMTAQSQMMMGQPQVMMAQPGYAAPQMMLAQPQQYGTGAQMMVAQPQQYGMGLQMMVSPAMQPVPAMYSTAMPGTQGPGYINSGDGRPAMVFGSTTEGMTMGAGQAYNQAYQSTYQVQTPGYVSPGQQQYTSPSPSQQTFTSPPPAQLKYASSPPTAQPAQYNQQSPSQPAQYQPPQPTTSQDRTIPQVGPPGYTMTPQQSYPNQQPMMSPQAALDAQATQQAAMVPRFLPATVNFTPVSAKVDTHSHALKALEHTSHSHDELLAVVGSYIAMKRTHELNHTPSGFLANSQPEFIHYNNMMDKLEALSADYVAKHKQVPRGWISALGLHRREIFAELYNNNNLVRGFCTEMPGGPLMLPELDQYALGTRRSLSSPFAKAAVRRANLSTGLELLNKVRTVILVDDSGSMSEQGHLSWGRIYPDTRWNQARHLLEGLIPLVAQHSAHGVDVHFLNRMPYYSGLRTGQALNDVFSALQPDGGTPTGARVNDILDSYMAVLRHYHGLLPLNLIVITDGEANDEKLLHDAIEHHVTQLVHRGFLAHQMGVEFLQVGDCEYATRHLERLEEEVSKHHRRFERDVVGVTPANRFNSMDSEKLLGIACSGIDARMNGYMRQRGQNV